VYRALDQVVRESGGDLIFVGLRKFQERNDQSRSRQEEDGKPTASGTEYALVHSKGMLYNAGYDPVVGLIFCQLVADIGRSAGELDLCGMSRLSTGGGGWL
jgi:hypothetical protein